MKRDYRQETWYKEMRNNLDTNEISCIYCGEKLIKETFTVDHIELYSDGGAGTQENCKPCCRFCNQLRGSMEYNEFISTYPKEKILKLKKYTHSGSIFDISGIDFMKDISNKLENIQNQISEILDNRNEISDMVGIYKELDVKISNEIIYSDNLNASQGYNLYVKKREIGRQLEKYKNQLRTINNIKTGLESALGLVTSRKLSVDIKMGNDQYSKIIPTLTEDIENVIGNKIKENLKNTTKTKTIASVKDASGKKVYKFADTSFKHHRKNQYNQLCQIWKNVKVDEINKVYNCSGKIK